MADPVEALVPAGQRCLSGLRMTQRPVHDGPGMQPGQVTVLGRLPPLKLVDRGDLSGANLTDALLGANLTRALLVGADLTGARLIGTDLSGANLTGARGLTQQQLDAALGNHETTLPPGQGLRRPERWLDGEAKPLG